MLEPFCGGLQVKSEIQICGSITNFGSESFLSRNSFTLCPSASISKDNYYSMDKLSVG